MIRANIKEGCVWFNDWDLTERYATDMIVVHHTGCADIDASAAQIDDWHKANGWVGIGYHYVVRKGGVIERGRPVWAVGSHAYGENSHTIGIHLSGDFETAQPTDQQIEMTAMLIANLCADYSIPIDRDHIVGHCDLMATDCPGKNLYARLDELIGKAAWYRWNTEPDAVVENAAAKTTLAVGDEYEVEGASYVLVKK